MAATLYGTHGPDKWSFVHDGILDREPDGTDHTFTIDGRRMQVSISAARPMPYWQCPKHPEIHESRHPYEWAGAWECWGSGFDEERHEAFSFHGVYSTKSRKGVYHVWPIHGGGGEGCPTAREDLQEFFTGKDNSESFLALERAMHHMVRGSGVGGEHHIDCRECWELFRTMRRSCDVG